MWIYSQSSGQLWDASGDCVATGYSGLGQGKNNPDLEGMKAVGPIPRGDWVMTGVYDSKRVGPLAIKLEPSGHGALGRDYFRIHGDSSKHPGEASKGCMIFWRHIRQTIIDSNDKMLRVIE